MSPNRRLVFFALLVGLLIIFSVIICRFIPSLMASRSIKIVDLVDCQKCDENGCKDTVEYKSLKLTEKQVLLVMDSVKDGAEIYKYPSGDGAYCNVIKEKNFMFECKNHEIYPGGSSLVSLSFDGADRFFYQSKLETYAKKYFDVKVTCGVKK